MRSERSPKIFWLIAMFLILSVLVTKQVMRPLDLLATETLQRFTFSALDYFMYFFTLFGSIEFTCFAILVVCWYLYRKYEWPGAFSYLFFFVALCGVEYIWKHIVVATGPELEFNRNPMTLGFVHVHTSYSFPSGHTFRSAFLLGIWNHRLEQVGASLSGNISVQKALIVFLVAAIGFSRVYLGDHWVSDVIGGYLLAAIGLELVSEPRQPEFRPA